MKTPVLQTSTPWSAIHVGDQIAVDIRQTTIRGLPATVTAIYLDRIEYQYNADSPVFAGLRGFIRNTRHQGDRDR